MPLRIPTFTFIELVNASCNIIQPIQNFLTIQLIPEKRMHAFRMLYQKVYHAKKGTEYQETKYFWIVFGPFRYIQLD